jgi:hypothetical protein
VAAAEAEMVTVVAAPGAREREAVAAVTVEAAVVTAEAAAAAMAVETTGSAMAVDTDGRLYHHLQCGRSRRFGTHSSRSDVSLAGTSWHRT